MSLAWSTLAARARAKLQAVRRTAAGRYLFAILIPKPGDLWVVASARDMMPNERRQYGRK
jgi:hypothetical protein